ncbi:hypothetical protein ACFQNE_13960 [Gordonia phosphorivorans]|uniref:DUF732 domain-containing protein n=1 Tax=Gordonia phosphorivorans TaxID=1056982 RepID=A0ABV6HBL1_9ACTN
MLQRATTWIGTACATLIATTGLAATAHAVPRVERVATVVSHHCENLGVTIPLSPAQTARAQALLPKGFRMAALPTLLVETSRCAGATVDGQRIGRFHLSEAALSIEAPRKIESRQLPDLVTENIYMLSQLDTDRLLSETKAAVGYPTELTEIALDRGTDGSVPRVMTATAGGELAPTSARADLTPYLLPAGVQVPNPGVVYQLWTKNDDGRFVVTTNSNLRIGTPAVGAGTVTVAPGTLLHKLLGARTASGLAFSGAASGFVNDTYVFSS